jgi:hypothetical protein
MIEQAEEYYPAAPAWMGPVDAMRWDVLQRGPAEDFRAYHRALAIDEPSVNARCGLVWTQKLQFFPELGRLFDLDYDEPGEPAVIIECIDADGLTRIDLCAWPVGRPQAFALAFGHADLLGLAHLQSPASYFGGDPVTHVWRTPERWLYQGCEGVVLLNGTSAPPVLAGAPGYLIAEDAAHARELARLLHPFFEHRRILVPQPRRAAA